MTKRSIISLGIVAAAGLLVFLAFFSHASAQTPTSAPSPVAEDMSVTKAAQTFYASLVADQVDRSKLSADVNSVLTDSMLSTLSGQLKGLGAPSWHYLRQVQAASGPASLYRLSYSSATIYLTFGISKQGTIYSLFFGNTEPSS